MCGDLPGAFNLGDGSKAAEAFSGLLETIAVGARTETPAASLDSFGRLALLVSDAWPAAALALRDALDTLVRQTPPGEGASLWRAFVSLRTWP